MREQRRMVLAQFSIKSEDAKKGMEESNKMGDKVNKKIILDNMKFKDVLKFVEEREEQAQIKNEEKENLFDKYSERTRRAYNEHNMD